MLDLRPLSERVYEILLQRIVGGEIIPGERLDADELSRSLGISKTPIRSAINRLAVEGLVEVNPRRSSTVTLPTRRDIVELFAIRRMIEQFAVEMALGHATEADKAHFRELAGRLTEYMDGDTYRDYLGFITLDNDVHTFLVDLADNRRLSAMYRGIRLHTRLARLIEVRFGQIPAGAQQNVREHEMIIAAFTQGTPEALRGALGSHIERSLARTLGMFYDDRPA